MMLPGTAWKLPTLVTMHDDIASRSYLGRRAELDIMKFYKTNEYALLKQLWPFIHDGPLLLPVIVFHDASPSDRKVLMFSTTAVIKRVYKYPRCKGRRRKVKIEQDSDHSDVARKKKKCLREIIFGVKCYCASL